MSIRNGISAILLFLTLAPLALAQAKITEAQAKLRKEQVSDVRYALSMDISQGEKEKFFLGEVLIDFNWKTSKEPLRIDFSKGEVKGIKLNGKNAAYTYDKEAILLKGDLFKEGPNSLTVTYKHPYSMDGSGLYRFVDPEDKKTYLYTQFETYDANQMFPNFDQPDLKAKFTFKVLAPKDWTIVSTVREEKIEIQKNPKLKLWHFPESLPISTYLFSLVAGPYKIWEDSKFRIPLRVMARQSLASYVRPDEWLGWTRFGFDYFEKTFGTPYPFLKYDQVLVPDFNAGAMENVANVTYNERFAPKGERTARMMERDFSTLLHEMAHMWFGDMVTMKWWDDLWLNESFATYASAAALASHPDFKHAWISFHQEKNWGYYADRLSTTHPIVSVVSDTDVAGSNFDGITYGKGAAWLKLLAFRVGNEDFYKGLKAYFAKHAFNNTTVDDLLTALETKPDLKLKDFAQSWLHSSGLNSVEVRANCSKDARLQSLDILQSAPSEHPDLRPHSMMVALYGDAGEADLWRPYKTLRADYNSAKTTIPVTEDLACPILIVPNASDDDFVKIVWPLEQLPRIQGDLARIADPMQRTLFWESLGFALDDGEVHLADVIKFTADQIPAERDYAVIQGMQDFIENHLVGRLRDFPDSASAQRIRFAKQLAVPFENMLVDSKTAKDLRLFAYDFYVSLLSVAGERETLSQIYQKKIVWPEFKLDQPRRWTLLNQLAAWKDPRVSAWAKAENDKSDTGALARQGIEAALLPYPQKRALIEKIMGPKSSLSRAQVRAVFNNVFPFQQNQDRMTFKEKFLKSLPAVSRNKEEFLRATYLLALLPTSCEESDDELIDRILKEEWPAYTRQELLERRDNLRYCRVMRMNAEAKSKS